MPPRRGHNNLRAAILTLYRDNTLQGPMVSLGGRIARHRTRRCMSTGDVLRTVFDDVGPSSAALSRRRFSYQGLRAVTKRILLF